MKKLSYYTTPDALRGKRGDQEKGEESKPLQEIFTDDLADKVLAQIAELPDDTPIGSLLILSGHAKKYYASLQTGDSVTQWIEFWQTLEVQQRKWITELFVQAALGFGKYVTTGNLRQKEIPEFTALEKPDGRRRFSENKAAFLKKIFPTPERSS